VAPLFDKHDTTYAASMQAGGLNCHHCRYTRL